MALTNIIGVQGDSLEIQYDVSKIQGDGLEILGRWKIFSALPRTKLISQFCL